MSRFTDIIDEPVSRILPALPDYEHFPLGTLEEAIRPVSHLFNGIDWYVWVARENSLRPADGLTVDESASIYLYTMSCSNGPSLYQELNKHLRTDHRETLRPWLPFLKLFVTALRKLPSQSRTVWQGARRASLWGSYPTGSQLTWWGVSSCPPTKDVFESDQTVKILFSIDCQNAKLITAHSRDRDTGREEFVLLPGTCFEVSNRVSDEHPTPVIYLREIESVSPTSTVASGNVRLAHEPTRAEIQTVLSYLDIFYPNGQTYNPIESAHGYNSVRYKPEVDKFFERIVDWCYDLDYHYTRPFLTNPETISTASWTALKQLLIHFTRLERNGPYAYSRAIEHGYIRRILLRMKELFP